MKKTSGFTLIEILVVVSIIGLITSIALANLSASRDKARIARAKTEMRQIAEAMVVAQGERGGVVYSITGPTVPSGHCTDCPCRLSYGDLADPDIRNISPAHICYTRWLTAITAIQTATNGNFTGLESMRRDPWGSPYLLDENEDENIPPDHPQFDCRHDTLRSAGPDGVVGEWIGGNLTSGDDIWYEIPYYKKHPECTN